MLEDPKNPQESKIAVWNTHTGWHDTIAHGIKPIAMLSVMSTLASLTATFAPFTIFGTGPTIVLCNLGIPIVHAWISRKYLLNPAYKRLIPSRRLFVRWLSRVGFANLIIYVYSPSIFWISILSCPLGFIAFTWLQKHYIHWQLDRQDRNEALHPLEKIILFTLAFGSFALFILLCITAATMGWLLQEFLQYFEIIP